MFYEPVARNCKVKATRWATDIDSLMFVSCRFTEGATKRHNSSKTSVVICRWLRKPPGSPSHDSPSRVWQNVSQRCSSHGRTHSLPIRRLLSPAAFRFSRLRMATPHANTNNKPICFRKTCFVRAVCAISECLLPRQASTRRRGVAAL